MRNIGFSGSLVLVFLTLVSLVVSKRFTGREAPAEWGDNELLAQVINVLAGMFDTEDLSKTEDPTRSRKKSQDKHNEEIAEARAVILRAFNTLLQGLDLTSILETQSREWFADQLRKVGVTEV